MSDQGRLETGDLVGERWQISHILGTGDIGEVYEAYDVVQASPFAVKLLAPQLLANRSKFDDFARTTRKGSDLLGTCAARIEEIEVDGASGSPFVVSEKLPETSLAAIVRKSGPITPDKFLDLLATLAPALDKAHAAGLVHGDIKPSNVFALEGAGNVRLTDFGISALRDESGAGPPGWCAPELFDVNAAPTAQSDMYALGLVAYFALTGKHAFAAAEPLDRHRLPGSERAGLRSASARAGALGVKLDMRLDRWFTVALDPKPARRFKTVSEMAVALGKQLGITLKLEAPPAIAPAPAAPAPAAPVPAKAAPAAATPEKPEERAAEKPVAARPMVVLDATPPPGSVGSGIATVSLKPLLFSDALPKPPVATSQPAEPPSSAARTPASPQPEAPRYEAPRYDAPPPERELEPSEKKDRGDALARTALAFTPADLGPADAAPTTVRAETSAAPPPSTGTNEERPAAPAELAGPPLAQKGAQPTSGVTVPLSVLLAVSGAILGFGLAMVALVLWLMSGRHASTEAKREPAPTAAPGAAPSGPAAPPATPPSEPAPGPSAGPQEKAAGEPASPDTAPPAAKEAAAPAPAGMASVTFVCSPVTCESVYCDAERYDATKPVTLRPGKHVCKGVASGYNMKGVTLHLAEGPQTQTFEMLPKKEAPAPKPGKKKPCGTFINPCK